jgi:hypothetical protein
VADIEKKKKGKKRRSLRAYQNMNKPVNPEAAALIDRFPPDDDDDDGPTPAHSEARAGTRAMMREKNTAADPLPHTAGRTVTDRLSEPLTAGHQAPSTGDHGVGAGRPPGIAVGHLDLRQSRVTVTPLATLSTAEGRGAADGSLGFEHGQAQLSRFDAAGATGLASAPGDADDAA